MCAYLDMYLPYSDQEWACYFRSDYEEWKLSSSPQDFQNLQQHRSKYQSSSFRLGLEPERTGRSSFPLHQPGGWKSFSKVFFQVCLILDVK